MAGVGVAGMQWRGEWADDVDYELGDLVSFDGNVYVTTGDQTVGTDPPDDEEWSLFAAPGVLTPFDDYATPLAAGEATAPRRNIVAGPAGVVSSGHVLMVYFRATRTETINNVAMMSAATAATGITLARIGIYSEAPNGDLTLAASTANDAALFSSAYTRYTKALTSPFSKVAGQRYAVGLLMVGTTPPALYLSQTQAGASAIDATLAVSPRLTGRQLGQADLPAAVTSASLVVHRVLFYAEITP